MKRLLVITLILSLAAATAIVAQPAPQGIGGCDRAQFGPHGKMSGRMGPGHGARGLGAILAHADEINLTDDQRSKLQQMQTAFQIERVDQKAKVEKARITLKAMMRDEAPESEVNAAIDNVSRLQADMKKMHYRHFTKARSVLTLEQVEKLKSLRKEFHQRGANRPDGRGKGQGRGWDFDPEG